MKIKNENQNQNESMITLKNVGRGEMFTLKDCSDLLDIPENLIWVKGDYDRSSKTYSCCKWEDANHENFFKAIRKVYAL